MDEVRIRLNVLPAKCSVEVVPVSPDRFQIRPIQNRPEGDLVGPWTEHDDGAPLVWDELWKG